MYVVGAETHVCLLSVRRKKFRKQEHEMTRNKRPILNNELFILLQFSASSWCTFCSMTITETVDSQHRTSIFFNCCTVLVSINGIGRVEKFWSRHFFLQETSDAYQFDWIDKLLMKTARVHLFDFLSFLVSANYQ